MHSKLAAFFFLLTFLFLHSHAQDTIVLLSGKTIIAKNIEVGMYTVSYHQLKEGSKQKHVSAENVFSIKHADGTEQVVYEKDSAEEADYNVDQMRMFIRGEQDAMKYYKNNVNKIAAFVCGGGASIFAFYGIVVPPIYSTVIGSFSPVMEKQKISDPALLHVDEYRDGYERKVKDNKVKNSLIYGFAGFVSGFAAYRIAFKK